MNNVVQMSEGSRTASNVNDELIQECMFIRAAADMFFTLENTGGDATGGLHKETSSTMMSRVIDAADRVEGLIGEYERLLRAEYEESRLAATSS